MGLGTPVLMLMLLGMVIMPLPPPLLDLLFTFNIALSMIVILMTRLREAAARLQRVPDGPSGRDAVAARAQYRVDARGPAARSHRAPTPRAR